MRGSVTFRRSAFTAGWQPGAEAAIKFGWGSQDEGIEMAESGGLEGARRRSHVYLSITTFQGPSAWMKKTAGSLPSTLATWGALSVRAK